MGFDNECILSIQSLPGEYFCPVCRLLVYPNEALQSQCTHLYCKPCLAYVANSSRACPYDGYLVTEAESKPLIESNKELAEAINKILVHCLYHRSGCTWQGPLSECVNHCSGCAFGNSPVVCNRCSVQIVHRQVQEHAQSCPGVQTQPQQALPSYDATAVTAMAANSNQMSKPAGTASITQALNEPAPAPTPEQWYQQQYLQYYQQYVGYDANNPQYQQGYPHQKPQEALQAQLPQQLQFPVTPQSQPLSLSSSQLKQQTPSNVQQPALPPHPQAQAQPHGQAQMPLQMAVQSQVPTVSVAPPLQQHQLQPAVQTYPQQGMQNHPPQPLQINQPLSHMLQYPQEVPTQNQMLQQHPQSAQHPQPQAQAPPQSYLQPYSQAQSQPVVPRPQVPLHMHQSQPNQHLPVLSTLAVVGYKYPPPQFPSQQTQSQLGGPQQHPTPIRPPQLSQQSVQVLHGQGQFPQHSLPTRPPQDQVNIPNQQNAGSFPPPIPSHSAQQPIYPQQSGQLVSSHTLMQSNQHLPQTLFKQQQASFGAQQPGLTQSTLHQQTPFPQRQIPVQTQMHPQGPTASHPFHPQQSMTVAHNLQSTHLCPNVGKSPVPNHGVHLQVNPHVPGMIPARLAQPASNSNNLVVPDNQVLLSSREKGGSGFPQKVLEKRVTSGQAGQRTIKVDEEPLRIDGNEMKKEVETNLDHLPFEQKGSEKQVASEELMAKEYARRKLDPSDSKSEKENQVGLPRGTAVQPNEIAEEQERKNSSLILEPSGSERIPAAAAYGTNYSTGNSSSNSNQKSNIGVVQHPLQQRVASVSGLSAPHPGHPHHSSGQPLVQHSHQLHPSTQSISSGGMSGHVPLQSPRRVQGQFQHRFSEHVPPDEGHLRQRHLGGIPPQSADRLGGIYISEKHVPNAITAENFQVMRPFDVESRQPQPTPSEILEHRPLGHATKIDRLSGVESSLFLGREKGFKSSLDEDMNAAHVNPSRLVHARKLFEEESRSFHDANAKHNSIFPSGGGVDHGPFQKSVHALPDGSGSVSVRMLPHDRDVPGKREFFLPGDKIERLGSSSSHTNMLGLVPGYAHHHREPLAIRSPNREHSGIRSSGFPSISHGSLGPDEIAGRKSHSYHATIGRSLPESRFQGFRGHAYRNEFEVPGKLGLAEHFRIGDLMGRDFSIDVSRRELLGPRNIHMGEPGGLDSFHHLVPPGELVGHEIYRQLGTRSNLFLEGHLANGHRGKGPFDDLRSRRISSMGWCRICGVDCETVEGLDLHSQTIEHQKVAIDMVRSIKHQNAKKQKLSSSDKSSVEDLSRSTPVRAKKH